MNNDMRKLIDETQRLDREATPGPWNPCGVTGCSCGLVWSGDGSHTIANCGDEEEGVAAHTPDAVLISNYRTAAPVLAAEVERLDARLAEVERERDEALLTLAAEVRRLRADLAFADQRGAEAIERVSTAIVNDKWNATAAFQDRAIKAEMENARLNVLLTASVTETARMQTERDELRALWTAEQQEHRQTARECGDVRQDALALRSELEEALLTLAAEQGRQEGAPSEGWQWTGKVWFHAPTCMVVEPAGRLWRLNPDAGDPRHWRLSRLEPMPARAAMLAADAATG